MAFASPVPVALGKIHEHSHNTVSADLDLFKVNPTQTSKTGGTWIPVQPVTESASSTQLQFVLPGSDEFFTDLGNSLLVVEATVTKKDGSALPGAASPNLKVWPVSNFPHAIFERMTCTINSVDVEHNAAYAQTAYIVNLMEQPEHVKKGRLTGEGWLEDEATGVDAADVPAAVASARKKLIADSRKQSFFIRPFTALNSQMRSLPPGVSIKLLFTRSNAAQCLMSTDDDPDVKVNILKAEWFVRRNSVNPTILRAHNARLLEGHTYKLPLEKFRTRVHTVPQGVRTHRIVLDQDDVIPTKVYLSMLTHKAHVGDFKLNPYKYTHHNLTSIELSIDGVPVGKRIDTDFENKAYAHAYGHTIASQGMLTSGASSGITYDDFGKNKCVFAWSTATDLPTKDDGTYFHLRRNACTAVVLTFKDALTEPLAVQITDSREDLVELDLEHRVRSVVGVI